MFGTQRQNIVHRFLHEKMRFWRKDYRRPDFEIPRVHLEFDLLGTVTKVRSKFLIHRVNAGVELILNGRDNRLLSVSINGKSSDNYRVEYLDKKCEAKQNSEYGEYCRGGQSLTIYGLEEVTELEILSECYPNKNTELSGLYESEGLLCTQCESEGFRQITYFLDRPDVMSMYEVVIRGNSELYPILLSNGDMIYDKEVKMEDGSVGHEVYYYDPFKKPCYLFALVAGKLACLEDSFLTMGDKQVQLFVYSSPEYLERCHYSLDVLKSSMKWDEDVYGRVYDLNSYRLVCIKDFNYGAMENKSLNLFNINSILCSKDSATDGSYINIAATIGHEYFHNWSGNRVTVKDWFQITLKEGFTSFREKNFVNDLYGYQCVLNSIIALRSSQFVEDNGPLAHPIRPESYIAIDNFYTATVYAKGCFVIRMIYFMLGEELFRKGTDYYFNTYDGSAIGCDEFIMSFQKTSKRDFTQFMNWYSQKGTPNVHVMAADYNQASKTFKLRLKQTIRSDAAHPAEGNEGAPPQPFHIPISFGLIGSDSKKDLIPTSILDLTEWEQEFELKNITERPIPSLLRNFNAPIILHNELLSIEDSSILAAHDPDHFIRWDINQNKVKQFILSLTKNMDQRIPQHILDALKTYFNPEIYEKDMYMAVAVLTPPTTAEIQLAMKPDADPCVAYKARVKYTGLFISEFATEIQDLYSKLDKSKPKEFVVDKQNIGLRSLCNFLSSLMTHPHSEIMTREAKIQFLKEKYEKATNYTDRMSAFGCILRYQSDFTNQVVQQAYDKAKGDPSLMSDWFGYQCLIIDYDQTQVIKHVEQLSQHPDFTSHIDPNLLRSIYREFSRNTPVFHADDGSGYKFFAFNLLKYDKLNSAVVSTIFKALVGIER